MSPTRMAIATGAPETVAAAVRVAEAGGNAVDVAIAGALTATVAETLLASLGGPAFLTIRPPGGAAESIDGADAVPTLPRDRDAVNWRKVDVPYGDGIEIMVGHGSVAVPGCAAALELAWQRHGSLPWKEIVAPALELARGDYVAGPTMTRWLELAGDLLFVQQPASRECYYPTGKAVRAGERFRIPHLDETLEAVARDGVSTLYTGDLSEVFAREMRENGGLVTREDLAAYRALVRKPLRLESGGFTLALNPPPAVGGAAVGSLIRLIEGAWKPGLSPAEDSLLHARAQAEFLQLREREIADPEFDESRAQALLEGDHLRRHAGKLGSPSTTHLSVATEDGWLVSATLSMGYGAGITIPGTGIACANSLGEPELNPQGFLKAAPGSRIISNMAPTLAWHTDGRALGIGSPGASRITTSIAQTWVRFGLEGATLEEAVRTPRLHVERRDDGLRVQCEPGIDTALLEKEFLIRHFDAPDMYFGAVKLAGVDRDGRLHAIADERRHGGTRIV